MTNNPSYTFYNKRYRTPLQDRDSSFNVLEDDEDTLIFTAMDMGNSGGTRRRCALCPQTCLCRGDCTECSDCGREYRAGCYDKRSYVVSVRARNDPPELSGPDQIWAVEGMPYSLINTDYYEMLGGTMWLRSGKKTIEDKHTPAKMQQQSEKFCNADGCQQVWIGPQQDPATGEVTWLRRKNGILITDPDSKDYGYDTRKIRVTLNCSHGRLFVNERFLEEVLFNGNVNCDLDTDPEVSELGCRIRLVDLGFEQGQVGLYTRKVASFAEPTTCPALVRYIQNVVTAPDGSKRMIERREFLDERTVPSQPVSTIAKSWGCPCYSNVIFGETGAALDREDPRNNRYLHCSQALFFNNRMPLNSGESVPLVGNRIIVLEGSLRDMQQALGNITYLPDPHFNTRVPGNSDEIHILVDDLGAIGDSLKDETGQIIPTAPLTGQKVIKVNVESVNTAPIIGRRVLPTCESKYADRKMRCPLGVNDPLTKNLLRIETWAQVENWPDINVETAFIMTSFNRSLDFIDIDEDSIFAITPDVLWVDDLDSSEAKTIYGAACTEEPRMGALKCENEPACVINCDDPYGLYLVNSYRCVGGDGVNDGQKCLKGSPTCGDGECELQGGAIFKTRSNPGELIVDLSVLHGKLSFYPRPPQFPRTLAPRFTVLTNMTPACGVGPSGFDGPHPCTSLLQSCLDAYGIEEFDCLFNVSHLWIRTTIEDLQDAIANKYITYVSDLSYFGPDTLKIFISDQGYTSYLYDTTKIVTSAVSINVVPINNAPELVPPASASVLNYQRGIYCRTSYMDFAGTQGTLCRFPDVSKVPPNDGDTLILTDMDINSITPACPSTCGNLTLIMTFQRPNSGALRFAPLVPTLQYDEFIDSEQRRTIVIWGKVAEMNMLMKNVFFDVDDLYTGYAPLTILANDMNNYGECARDLYCSRYDEANIQSTPCTRANRMPCVAPIPGISTHTVDFVVGSMQLCKYETCLACNRDKKCGWCPTTCGGQGKCMIRQGANPKFEICEAGLAWFNTSYETNVSRGSSFGLCQPSQVNLPLVILAGVVGFGSLVWLIHYTVSLLIRRYGTLWAYLRKKQFNLTYTGRKLHVLPPPGADYFGFAFVILTPLVVISVLSGALDVTDSPYDFKNAFYLDTVQSLTLKLDNCHLRFLPKNNFDGVDKELDAIKLRFAYPNHPLISLKSDTCNPDMTMELMNDKSDDTKFVTLHSKACHGHLLASSSWLV